jgi:hypothetical protein
MKSLRYEISTRLFGMGSCLAQRRTDGTGLLNFQMAEILSSNHELRATLPSLWNLFKENTSPENREIGLAGFRAIKNPPPSSEDGSS